MVTMKRRIFIATAMYRGYPSSHHTHRVGVQRLFRGPDVVLYEWACTCGWNTCLSTMPCIHYLAVHQAVTGVDADEFIVRGFHVVFRHANNDAVRQILSASSRADAEVLSARDVFNLWENIIEQLVE